MGWKHRLSNVNLVAMTADCAHCGPNVPLHNFDRPRCWYGRQKGGNYGSIKIKYEEKMTLWKQEQNRRCKICNKPLTYEEAKLDHCHDTDTLRNFLCQMCNFGLGAFNDNVESLQRAVEYLTNKSKWLKYGKQGR